MQFYTTINTVNAVLNLKVGSNSPIARSGHTVQNKLCWDAIDHFTVVGLVTWPLNGSEAGVDLVLIQTSLFLLCKSSCSYAN